MLHPLDWSLVPAYAVAFVFGYLAVRSRSASCSHGSPARRISAHWLGQYRRHQCVAHRQQGARRRDARRRHTQGHGGGCRHQRGLWRDAAICAALGAFLGHLFPVWLRLSWRPRAWRPIIGLLLGFQAWLGLLAFCAIWLAIAALTRYSSLAALLASAATPAVRGGTAICRQRYYFLLLSVMLWIMHRTNIGRLMSGTETRIGGQSEH